jgi:DNA-binding NarL/FixJ family response regulator
MASNLPPDKKTRVLVVDDHPMMRDSLIRLINKQPDLICCCEAGSAAETQEAAVRHKPDFAILDLRLKNSDGLDLIKSLKAQFPELRILVLSQCDGSLYAERALRAGAMGYLDKEQAAEEVLNAIRTVLAGEVYLTRGLAAQLLHRFVGGHPKARDDAQPLTDRELHVLELLGSGMSTREIANALNLSFKTIETHRENIKHKLGLRGAAALAHYASEWASKQSNRSSPRQVS